MTVVLNGSALNSINEILWRITNFGTRDEYEVIMYNEVGDFIYFSIKHIKTGVNIFEGKILNKQPS